MDNVYVCPAGHDGRFKIHFIQIVMPGGIGKDGPIYSLRTPSVPNPGSYRHIKLVQKNLGWGGLDVILCWSHDDQKDACLYLGKWEEESTEILNVNII